MPVVSSGAPATGSSPVVSGPGKLLGFLISHQEVTAQGVVFYDNTTATGTVLLTVYVAPERSPCFLMLPRDLPFKFSTGLTVDNGTCAVNVWAVAY